MSDKTVLLVHLYKKLLYILIKFPLKIMSVIVFQYSLSQINNLLLKIKRWYQLPPNIFTNMKTLLLAKNRFEYS